MTDYKMIVHTSDGGVYIDGRFTSKEALDDVKNWLPSEEQAREIFGVHERWGPLNWDEGVHIPQHPPCPALSTKVNWRREGF